MDQNELETNVPLSILTIIFAENGPQQRSAESFYFDLFNKYIKKKTKSIIETNQMCAMCVSEEIFTMRNKQFQPFQHANMN